jgi:hypothetical protein
MFDELQVQIILTMCLIKDKAVHGMIGNRHFVNYIIVIYDFLLLHNIAVIYTEKKLLQKYIATEYTFKVTTIAKFSAN